MVEQGGRGGVADYTAELTRALAAEGWLVCLATADDHRYQPAPGVGVERVFHYVRGDSPAARWVRRRRLGTLVNGLRFLPAIPRLLRLSRGADIVHSQGWERVELGVLAIICLRLAGARVVETSHNTFDRGRSQVRIRGALAGLTSHTIVHTQADLARVPREADGRVVVIPHGEYGSLARTGGEVDPEAARAALGLGSQTPVTLMFGQLRPDKGLGDLLAALQRIPELHLVIGGQEVGALAQQAETLRRPEIARRVTIREGFLDMSEAAWLFAAADTVALPYRAASQSGVLLLAYGFRRPVIIYPVGGLSEGVVDGETGWVCERADRDALAQALRASVRAGRGECRRRGEQGNALSLERYAWPASAARTARVYREVLDAQRR